MTLAIGNASSVVSKLSTYSVLAQSRSSSGKFLSPVFRIPGHHRAGIGDVSTRASGHRLVFRGGVRYDPEPFSDWVGRIPRQDAELVTEGVPLFDWWKRADLQ